MKAGDTLPVIGLIRLPTVLKHVEESPAGWYRGIQAGIYPKPIKVGRKSFWRAEQVRELIERLSSGEEAFDA